MSNVAHHQRGFTIVELMIATTVFSVIILAITAATTVIGKAYQRSLYASNTQATASNLVDTLSQSVRFSSGPIMQQGDPAGEPALGSGTGSYCIGNRQILYTYGRRVGDTVSDTSSRYAVVSRPSNGCAVTQITGATPTLTDHKELLGRGMRLSKLEITQSSGGVYMIEVRVVYGEDDLLCSDSVPGSCNPGSTQLTSSQLKNTDLRCKPGAGSEYCAVSELSSTAYRRL